MRYIDREGRTIEYEDSQDRFLKMLYTSRTGRIILKLLIRPSVSRLGGRLLDTRLSAGLIRPFVKHNHIDLNQYREQSFQSYNAFFTRQIKSSLRPVDMNGNVLVSPCDGKLGIYLIDAESRFTIKHTDYTLSALLRSEKLAGWFQGGYACIFRLTVDDYHRFCYMDDGVKSRNYVIPGVLHTVNPAANDVYPIYKENAREFCLIKSRNFGTMAVMEVGAMLVGKISNYCLEEGPVKKGQEKGRFEFGGSTIVVLLQKDRVLPDQDLLRNTENGCETIIKMGERIGVRSFI